jgi:quercetin dioxygenase-like cupin family protein
MPKSKLDVSCAVAIAPVIEGELEVTIDGVTQIARAGMVAIVPSNVPHSVKALTDGWAIIVDYPLRGEFV